MKRCQKIRDRIALIPSTETGKNWLSALRRSAGRFPRHCYFWAVIACSFVSITPSISVPWTGGDGGGKPSGGSRTFRPEGSRTFRSWRSTDCAIWPDRTLRLLLHIHLHSCSGLTLYFSLRKDLIIDSVEFLLQCLKRPGDAGRRLVVTTSQTESAASWNA